MSDQVMNKKLVSTQDQSGTSHTSSGVTQFGGAQRGSGLAEPK